ncbi:hypothetical protein HGP16_27875 [Rhizobium sp. P40RR-XXII]|uniref:hypothetical protein n=1 Tax=Rhizobium sp. P40RR-XXII TaxID=2726739 RepID=UPI001456430B|nr:hypothetical protein [Rhizobium sp. P40RR-XXII]NLS20353.1 hypothetical protein [Rhizobium sp. P40RR-XXII]
MPKAKNLTESETTSAVAPSIGEIMGRLLVLDMMAASATVRLLRLHDGQEKAELTAQILHEIDSTCRRRGLHLRDILDAQDYAKKILSDAQAHADRLDDIKFGYLDRNRN